MEFLIVVLYVRMIVKCADKMIEEKMKEYNDEKL